MNNCKRINLALTLENYDFVKTMATLDGKSMTEFINDMITKRRSNNELHQKIIAIRDEDELSPQLSDTLGHQSLETTMVFTRPTHSTKKHQIATVDLTLLKAMYWEKLYDIDNHPDLEDSDVLAELSCQQIAIDSIVALDDEIDTQEDDE